MATATKKPAKPRKRAPKKKTTDVLVAWCIDRSGSMSHFVNDTIEGFNAFLAEQQKIKDGQCLLSLVLFDDAFTAPVVATDVNEVRPLNVETYWVGGGGMTALYDAVGVTINGVEAWLENNPSFKGKVVVEIWTDGGENVSKRWSQYNGGLAAMMAKITEKQVDGWTFSFLGSGGSAWTEGRHFENTVGHANTTQTTATASGTRVGYAAVSNSVNMLRSTGSYMSTNDSLKAVATQSETLASFGIDDVEEALAGTDNKT